MKRLHSIVYLLPILLLCVPSTIAWGAAGHAIVATIAQSLLHPSIRSHLCTILPSFTAYNSSYPRAGAPHRHCHLATLASWPDTIKFRIPWSGHYHYINPLNDTPPDHCTFGQDGGFVSEENVLTSLVNYTRQVGNAPTPSSSHDHGYSYSYERDVALRFVTHLMGDLHQPLHLTGRQRGGNDVWVRFAGRKARLHSVWDGLMINKQVRELSNYTTPLNSLAFESALQGKVWDAYTRWIAAEGLGLVKSALGGKDPWWSQEEQREWVACPQGKEEGHSLGNRKRSQMPMMFDPLPNPRYDGPTNHVDETDLPICPMAWGKPMHGLVCKYAFAEPVAHHNLSSTISAKDDDDGDDDDDNDDVDAERRRRRRRRRPATPPSPPSTPPHQPTPDLPELDSEEYFGRINDDHVIQKQLAMGGIRLAAVLNSLLWDEAQQVSAPSTYE